MSNMPLMELLLAHNANINVQGGSEKMTVLHEAVSSDNSDETLIKFLLEHGADPHIEYDRIQRLRWMSFEICSLFFFILSKE